MSGPVDERLNGDANLLCKDSGLCSEEVCTRFPARRAGAEKNAGIKEL